MRGKEVSIVGGMMVLKWKNRMETAFSIQSDYLTAEYTDAYQTERKKCG